MNTDTKTFPDDSIGTLKRRLQSKANPAKQVPSGRLATAGLLLLCIVPVAAGIFRLIQLGTGAEITPENARFFDSPAPVVIHIISVSLYGILGALQFAPRFRLSRPRWHRRVGRVLVPLGLSAALSGLWMTIFYALPAYDGEVLYMERLIVGSWMLYSLGMGYLAVRQHKFANHGAWMIRAYAIAMGAGTQVFTHIPYEILFGKPTEGPRAVLMGAGWVINFLIAEWIISQRLTRPVRNSQRKLTAD